MKVNIMSVAYERPIPIRILIDSFIVQTREDWKLTIIHDYKASNEVHKTIGLYDDPRIVYKESLKRLGAFGHPNRKQFLIESKGAKDELVLLTNDDNYYVPVFIEKILDVCKSNTGMVYCDTVHSHFDYNVLKTIIRADGIDIGSFLVRGDIAKKVGFNHFQFNGDGFYAKECALECIKRGLKIEYIPKPLFVHN